MNDQKDYITIVCVVGGVFWLQKNRAWLEFIRFPGAILGPYIPTPDGEVEGRQKTK